VRGVLRQVRLIFIIRNMYLILSSSRYRMAIRAVSCFGRRKTSISLARCSHGHGRIFINGMPSSLWPDILKAKLWDVMTVIGRSFSINLDLKVIARRWESFSGVCN
jgi:hypothetical protein